MQDLLGLYMSSQVICHQCQWKMHGLMIVTFPFYLQPVMLSHALKDFHVAAVMVVLR